MTSPLQGRHILFLGSSVTYGSAADGRSFVEDLVDRTGCVAIKEAVSGTTLADIKSDSYVARLKKLEINHVDLFVCQLSTNDATQGMPMGEASTGPDGLGSGETHNTETIAGAIESIIDYVKRRWGCPIAFFTNPKYESEEYERMVALLTEIAEKWGIDVIDLWNDQAFNAEKKDGYMADPIHPTRDGYRKWWTPYFADRLSAAMSPAAP